MRDRRADSSRMRVLIAPDSFKGTLTSVEVARALAAGWRLARPGDDIRLAPLADGGEGTLVAIEAALGEHVPCLLLAHRGAVGSNVVEVEVVHLASSLPSPRGLPRLPGT